MVRGSLKFVRQGSGVDCVCRGEHDAVGAHKFGDKFGNKREQDGCARGNVV